MHIYSHKTSTDIVDFKGETLRERGEQVGKTLLSIRQNCHQSFVLYGIYIRYTISRYMVLYY